MTDDEQQAPLEGFRIVELGRVVAAPFTAMMLGDMGADVIKVERPDGGDETRSYGPYSFGGMSFHFVSGNRNKRSLTLDLKNKQGAEAMRRLLKTSDAFVTNTLPGSLERLGLGYPQVGALYPKLVYCMIGGWGLRGPQRDRPALDIVTQAGSGQMLLTGPEGGDPQRSGIPVGDLSAAMYAAFAVVVALLQRQRTGRGQLIDTSLFEAASSMLHHMAGQYFITGEAPKRLGNAHPSMVPYDTYQTKDGWVALAVSDDLTWQRLCAALGLASLAKDKRFAGVPDRNSNRQALNEAVGTRLRELPSEDLVKLLEESRVPCEKVKDVREVFESENAEALGLRANFSHPAVGPMSAVATPYHLSEWPETIRRPPPQLGEHTDEILRELGYDAAAIEEMRQRGTIA